MAQFGSALDWGSRGRKFKSCHSDQTASFTCPRKKKGEKSSLLFFLMIVSLPKSFFAGKGSNYDARYVIDVGG